jgi:hypothetical protein
MLNLIGGLQQVSAQPKGLRIFTRSPDLHLPALGHHSIANDDTGERIDRRN